MSEDNSIWLTVGCSAVVLAAVSLSYSFIEPNRGVDLKAHAIYAAASICSVAFIPTNISSYVFTELSVTLVGCVYPVYRATKAVCTPDEGDDKEWLQYWMLGGVLFCLTTWMYVSSVVSLTILMCKILHIFFPTKEMMS